MQSYIPMGGEAASLNPEVISIQRAFIIKMKNKEKLLSEKVEMFDRGDSLVRAIPLGYVKDFKVHSFSIRGSVYNEKDLEILSLLSKKDYSVSELTKKLDIAPVNTWKHLNLLTEQKLINNPKVKKGERKVLSLTKIGREFYQSLSK